MNYREQFKKIITESVNLSEAPFSMNARAAMTAPAQNRSRQYHYAPVDQLEDKKSRIETLFYPLRGFEDKILSLKIENEELEKRINELRNQKNSIEDKKQELEKELSNLDAEDKKQVTTVSELSNYIDQLNNKLENLKSERKLLLGDPEKENNEKINKEISNEIQRINKLSIVKTILQDIEDNDEEKLKQQIKLNSEEIKNLNKEMDKYYNKIKRKVDKIEKEMDNYEPVSDSDYKLNKASHDNVTSNKYSIEFYQKLILEAERAIDTIKNEISNENFQVTDVEKRIKKLEDLLKRSTTGNEAAATRISLETLHELLLELSKTSSVEAKEKKINQILQEIERFQIAIRNTQVELINSILIPYEHLFSTIKYYNNNDENSIKIDKENNKITINAPFIDFNETYDLPKLEEVKFQYTLKGKIYSKINKKVLINSVLPALKNKGFNFQLESWDDSNIGQVGSRFDVIYAQLRDENKKDKQPTRAYLSHGLTKVLKADDWKEIFPQLKDKSETSDKKTSDDNGPEKSSTYQSGSTIIKKYFEDLIKWLEERGYKAKISSKSDLTASVELDDLKYLTYYPNSNKIDKNHREIYYFLLGRIKSKPAMVINFSIMPSVLAPIVQLGEYESGFAEKYRAELNKICMNIKRALCNSINISNLSELLKDKGLLIDPELIDDSNTLVDYDGKSLSFIDKDNNKIDINLHDRETEEPYTQQELQNIVEFNNENANKLEAFANLMSENNFGKFVFAAGLSVSPRRLVQTRELNKRFADRDLSVVELAFLMNDSIENVFNDTEEISTDKYAIKFTLNDGRFIKEDDLNDVNKNNILIISLDPKMNFKGIDIINQLKSRLLTKKESVDHTITEENLFLDDNSIVVEFDIQDYTVNEDHEIIINSATLKTELEEDGLIIKNPGLLRINIDEIREDILKNYDENEYNFDSLLLDLKNVQKDSNSDVFVAEVSFYNSESNTINIENGELIIPYTIINKKQKESEEGQATTNDFEFVESPVFKELMIKYIKSLKFIRGDKS